MDILIKGMEMPENCGFCRLRHADIAHGDACSVKVGLWCEFYKRPDDCPLVLVQPHGRLVDADALMHKIEKVERAAERAIEKNGQEYSCSLWYFVEDMLENAPTIISASEGVE